MEKSDSEETEDIINEEKNKAATEQAKKQLGEEEYLKIEKAARENARQKFMELYPMKDGETKEEYSKRFEAYWDKNSTKYLAEAKLYDSASENGKNAWSTFAATSDKFVENFAGDDGIFNKLGQAYTDLDQQIDSLGESSSGNGSGGSGNVNDIYEAASQVWEAMAAKAGGSLYAYNNHGPITTRSGITLDEVHPDCSGMISATMNYMGYDFRGTMNGSNKRWTTHDISGKTKNNLIYKNGELTNDWTFIPYNPDEVREGDILTTPDHVGLYVEGNSANAKGFDAGNGDRLPVLGNGAAKAYLSGDPNWKTKLQWTMGPGYDGLTTILRYTKPMPGQGKIDLSDNLAKYSAWSGYSSRAGVPTFINAGKAAGMSGAEIATLASTGIWEDGGEKIFGIKSLTGTTYDYNGQAAKGIMNWVDQDVNYGDTVLDQLKWIHNTYFDDNSSDWRAKVRDNGYMTQDTQAFKDATGRSGFKLNVGDRYGPYANKDLIEGSAFFFMDALIPQKIHTMKGMAENVGTAAEAYNWMIDNGYIDYDENNPTIKSPTGQGSVSTGFGMVNSQWDAQVLSNIEQIGTSNGKNTGTVNTNDTGLALKEKPDLNSKFLIEIPKGTKLNLETSGSKDWFKTSFAGRTGYVYAKYIKLDKNELTNSYKTQNYSPTTSQISSGNLLTDYSNKLGTILNKDINLSYINTSNDKTSTVTPATKPTTTSWYDFGSWFTLNDNAEERKIKRGYYDTAADYHTKAMKGIGKANIQAFGTEKANIEDYLSKYGLSTVRRGTTQHIANNWEYYADQWANVYDSTKNSSFVDYTSYPIYQQLQALGKIYGSGDNSDLDFWNNYMNWNNNYATTPIPENNAYYQSYTADDNTGTTVFNHYSITRAENTDADRRLKAILEHTYNVRSESMESIMLEILKELKKKKDPNGGNVDTNGSVKLFDEKIPSQVINDEYDGGKCPHLFYYSYHNPILFNILLYPS